MPADLSITEKRRPCCSQVLPCSEFFNVRTKRDGLSAYCKICAGQKAAIYRASPKGVEGRQRIALRALNPPEEKRCTKCTETKPREGFYKTCRASSGLMPWCKSCVNAQHKTPSGQEVARRSRVKNRTAILASNREWKARVYGVPEGKALRRAVKLKFSYGLTTEDFERMRAEQNDGCATCKQSTFATKPLCVDHDHATGKVRGLLCSPCNTILGRWKDSPAICENAKQYLLKHGNVIEADLPDSVALPLAS